MRTALKPLILCGFVCFFGACATKTPSLITFPTESGATQYFFPMMEWKADQKDIGAVCDITYRYESGSQGIYNISFSYTAKSNKGKVPSMPSALSLEGDGTSYALLNIGKLFSNPETSTTRTTSPVEGEDLLAILRSASIALIAVIDGTQYRFTPPKQFLEYRDKFLADIAVRNVN
jgi:hypothetical protein